MRQAHYWRGIIYRGASPLFYQELNKKGIMAQVKAPEVEQPEKKTVDLIPKERLKEILDILLPYGYSHYEETMYTGVSPFIGRSNNIITIVANDPKWGSVFAICMERFTEEEDEGNSIGFYKGIMKMIAPELHCNDDNFKGGNNVLDFNWADDYAKNNRFPVKVELIKKRIWI